MSLKDSTKKRKILPAASDEMRHRIYVFLSRDDNSSLCPAKAASTRCEEGRKQNRILSDYVYALHLKFLSENTDMKVSQSLFYRLVPVELTCIELMEKKASSEKYWSRFKKWLFFFMT